MCFSTIGYTALMWFIVHTFPHFFIGLFSNDPQQFEIGIPAMRIYYFGFFMMALQFVEQTTFVALGTAKKAIFFSLFRKVVIVGEDRQVGCLIKNFYKIKSDVEVFKISAISV